MLDRSARAGAVGILSIVAACLGYGGFEVTASYVDLSGLNQTLTTLNRNWSGSGQFRLASPLWWLGGHGGRRVGVLTLGGSGQVSARTSRADSLGCELVALRGQFDAGYPYAPVDWFWVRPSIDVGLAGWAAFAHSVENSPLVGYFQPNLSQWFLAWTLGAAPGIEVMGCLPSSRRSFIGLFASASYFIPVVGPRWFVRIPDAPSPEFGLSGFAAQIGLRFGGTPYRAFRI